MDIKRIVTGAFFIMLSVVAFQGLAVAEVIQGQIAAVNQQEQTITVQSTGDQGQIQLMNLSVGEDTRYQGVQSLADLNVGDQVRIEAEGSFFGQRQVTRVESTQAGRQGTGLRGQSQQAGTSAQSSASGQSERQGFQSENPNYSSQGSTGEFRQSQSQGSGVGGMNRTDQPGAGQPAGEDTSQAGQLSGAQSSQASSGSY